MAISPRESQITLILSSASSILYADEVQYTATFEAFDRVEFSNERLRSAKSPTGAQPLIVTTFGGSPIQIGIVCTSDSPRPLTPDDANVNAIKRKWAIDRFTIAGAVSLAAEVEEVRLIAVDHQDRLARFQSHLQKGTMDISYPALVAMQAETFSYITTTGLTIVGPAIGTLNNALITSFTTDVAYEVTPAGGGSLVLQTWNMTVESRVNEALSA